MPPTTRVGCCIALVVLLSAACCVTQAEATLFLFGEMCVIQLDTALGFGSIVLDKIPQLEETLLGIRDVCQLIVEGTIEGKVLAKIQPPIKTLLLSLANPQLNFAKITRLAEGIQGQIGGEISEY